MQPLQQSRPREPFSLLIGVQLDLRLVNRLYIYIYFFFPLLSKALCNLENNEQCIVTLPNLKFVN